MSLEPAAALGETPIEESESVKRRKFQSKREYEAAVDAESSAKANANGSNHANGTNGVKSADVKRADVISWDEYFMAVAKLSAMRSKDPSTQVGACIVNPDNRIVGIGYNGFPRGCSDDQLPWCRVCDDELGTKYPYVCHAEMNAIMNKNAESLKGCTIYVALFPCNECAKLIIQSGIVSVIYLSDKYHNMPFMIASRRMLDMAKVEQRQFVPTRKQVLVTFDEL